MCRLCHYHLFLSNKRETRLEVTHAYSGSSANHIFWGKNEKNFHFLLLPIILYSGEEWFQPSFGALYVCIEEGQDLPLATDAPRRRARIRPLRSPILSTWTGTGRRLMYSSSRSPRKSEKLKGIWKCEGISN